MGLPKFFVAPGSVRGSFLTLEGENAAHARVLRLRQGDRVLVCDGCGTDYSCTISDISPQQVCLVVDSASASASEPRVQCSVYMAYAKADKLEHVIQKATELGAYAVKRAAGCELALLPYENEHALSLRRAVGEAAFETVSIMTGPEGGFSEDEVRLAQEAGMQICTLGPRILRCETAPLCALSAVLYAAGALD